MTELDPELRCESENTFLDPADQAALLEEAQELELVDERTLRDHFLHPDTKDLATAGSVVGGLLAIYFAARALRRRDGKISMPDGDVSLHLEPAEYMKGFVSYVTKKGESAAFEVPEDIASQLREKLSDARERLDKVKSDPKVGAFVMELKDKARYPFRDDDEEHALAQSKYRKAVRFGGALVNAAAASVRRDKTDK